MGLRLGVALGKAAALPVSSLLFMNDNLGVLHTASAYGRSRTDAVWQAASRAEKWRYSVEEAIAAPEEHLTNATIRGLRRMSLNRR